MRKLTVLVDMDDVLEDLSGAWTDYLNWYYGTSVSKDDIRDWDFSLAFPELTAEQAYGALNASLLWENAKPIDGAQEYLQKLIDDGHRVVIVTASHPKNILMKYINIICRYFRFLSYKDIIITCRKDLVRGDVLIDDGPHNFEGNVTYRGLLMTAPHNRFFDAEKAGLTRVNNWGEAYEAVCKIASE